MEFGKPNPNIRDINGKAPIHIAAAKLDLESFDELVKKGADPMMPDNSGNNFLHIMATSKINDVEYDFIKMSCDKYNLSFTRNKQLKTPLNMVRGYTVSSNVSKGQPNYRKKI